MPEKVNIASLTIDFDEVIKNSGEYIRKIDELKKAQKGLDKTTVEGRNAYAKNAAELKNLSKALRDNQQFAAALDSANKDLVKTMAVENKSRLELIDSRRELNQIVKNIKGETEEELELIIKLNKAIDDQTVQIRKQSSGFNASKDQIGEYKDNIIEAFNALKVQESTLKAVRVELEANLEATEEGTDEYEAYSQALVVVNNDLEKVNDSLETNTEGFDASNLSIQGFLDSSKESGGATKLLTDGVKAGGKAIVGMTKSALAFLATPFGVIVLLIGAAFLLVKNAMNRSEEATNKVKTAFSAFTGIIKGVLQVLAPLGDFLIDVLVKSLEFIEKSLLKTLGGIADALEFFGLDKAANSMRNFNQAIEESAENSKALTKAQLELDKATRIARKTQLEFLNDAEKLRQIRDDETKSIQERQEANDALGATLRKQLAVETDLANKALIVAEARIKADGETKEALDQRAAALTELADIQERIVGQESEQIVNRVSLQKEANEQLKKLQEDAIKVQNDELNLFIKRQGIKAKTLEENLKIEREISAKKIEILNEELRTKAKTQAEFDAELIELQNDLLLKQAEVSADNASRELDLYIQNNESKLDADKFLTEQALEEEQRRIDLIAEKQKEFQKKQFDLGLINQTEFNAAINAINEENRVSNEELEKERTEAAAEQSAIDLENKIAANAIEFENEFEVRQQQLDAARAAEIDNSKKTGASIELINKKFDASEKRLSKDLAEFKVQQNSIVFAGAANLLGQSSALGKSFAIAEIINDTALNAGKAFNQAKVFASNPLTFPLAANATFQGGLIVATGAAQVAKTVGLKLKKGGVLKGDRHSDPSGGIPLSNGDIGEDGEAVINRISTAMFRPELSAMNVAGGGKAFAGGGILGTTSSPSPSLPAIDYDILAATLGEEIQALSIKVSVEEINDVNTNVKVAETNALL